MRIVFTIEGAAEFDRNLATLPGRCQKSVFRTATRAAQEPLKRRVQLNARALPYSARSLYAVKEDDVRMSELIAASIHIVPPKRQKASSYAMQVQIDNRPEFFHKTEAGREYWIPWAIEYGHGSTKEAAARPYMRPAVDTTIEETKRILANELGAGILREVIKGRYK